MGANANTDFNGTTALKHAASSGDVTMVKLLLSHGADPNGVDDGTNDTPLKSAIDKKHPEIVELLKKAGATR